MQPCGIRSLPVLGIEARYPQGFLGEADVGRIAAQAFSLPGAEPQQAGSMSVTG